MMEGQNAILNRILSLPVIPFPLPTLRIWHLLSITADDLFRKQPHRTF